MGGYPGAREPKAKHVEEGVGGREGDPTEEGWGGGRMVAEPSRTARERKATDEGK